MARPLDPSSKTRRTLFGIAIPPVVGIFFTVFLDLLGFGLFLPDLQLRALQLGAHAESMALIQSVYSFTQLLTAPILGFISDRFGRRRVLMATTTLSVVGYLVYGHASALWIMFVARGVLGIAGASVGVAFAYMADITTPEKRAKGMGILGAGIGLGFIFGPVIGGILLTVGHDSPLILGYVGAALSFANFLYVWLLLPDSEPLRTGQVVARKVFENVKTAFRAQELAFLLIMFFVVNFAFTNLETTFFLLLHDPHAVFHFTIEGAKRVGSIILGIIGVVGAIVQGGLIRTLLPKYGEVKLLRFAFVLMPLALLLIPFAKLWFPGILCLMGLAVAMGLYQPSLSSLISRNAPSSIQGGTFGITQLLGALARLIAPQISLNAFYLRPYLPYLIAAAIYVFPIYGAWRIRQPHADEVRIDGEALAV